jgi:hypothetical protein
METINHMDVLITPEETASYIKDWSLSDRRLAEILSEVTVGRLRSLAFCPEDIARARAWKESNDAPIHSINRPIVERGGIPQNVLDNSYPVNAPSEISSGDNWIERDSGQ